MSKYLKYILVPISLVAGYIASLSIHQNPIQHNIDVCFSPEGNCKSKIISCINQAKNQIRILSYSFTSKPIANALIVKHKAGVSVKIIADREQLTSKYSVYPELISAGIKINIPKSIRGLQHNKCIIIDDEIVITGSYNFSYSANDKNAENLLVITDNNLVKQYSQAWNKLNTR